VGQLAFTGLAALRAFGGAPPDLVYARDRMLAAVVRRSCPLIFEVHEAAEGIRRRVESIVFRRPSVRTVLISETLRAEYRARYPGVVDGRAIVAPSGHRRRPVGPPPFPRRADRITVGYLGHFYPGKGVRTLSEVARRLPDFDFVAVGGPEAEAARWRRTAEALHNFDVHDAIPPARGDDFLASMDVLVAPYERTVQSRMGNDITRWMSPMKIVAYLAAGKAIVASDLPAVRELLTDGETALLVAPEDVGAWVDTLARLRDPELRAQLGRAASARFERDLSWSARAARILRGFGE
jgi:glycosyltransferase involved in cell wall biosynthesis